MPSNKLYIYITAYFFYLSQNSYLHYILSLVKEKEKNKTIRKERIEKGTFKKFILLGSKISNKMISLDGVISIFLGEEKLGYRINIEDIETSNQSIFKSAKDSDKQLFFSTIQSSFVSFYENYKEEAYKKIGNKEFYDFNKNVLNFDVWALAQAVRNIISHNGKINYDKSKHPILYNLKIHKIKFCFNGYFEFEFKDEYQGKDINELFSPVELILLMILMEKEIS